MFIISYLVVRACNHSIGRSLKVYINETYVTMTIYSSDYGFRCGTWKMYEDIYVHIHPRWERFHPWRIHDTIYSSAVGTVPSADYSTVRGHSKILHYYVVI